VPVATGVTVTGDSVPAAVGTVQTPVLLLEKVKELIPDVADAVNETGVPNVSAVKVPKVVVWLAGLTVIVPDVTRGEAA
jgi:hypothetical protein